MKRQKRSDQQVKTLGEVLRFAQNDTWSIGSAKKKNTPPTQAELLDVTARLRTGPRPQLTDGYATSELSITRDIRSPKLCVSFDETCLIEFFNQRVISRPNRADALCPLLNEDLGRGR